MSSARQSRRTRSNSNNNRRIRRRLNPPERPPIVTLRVYSSNYRLMMAPNENVVFPMELVPNELQLYLEERFFPSFITALTGKILNYPPGEIIKEGNKYYLEIKLADIQDYGRAEGYDLENTDGIPEGRTEGSIKMEINVIDGALDNIDGDNGPMKFYIREPVSIDALYERSASFYVPTDHREKLRAHQERNRYIRELENPDPFQQGQGSGVGYAIGGRRRRKKRTKKKRRKSRKKRRKKKTKRRK
tara:strand:- start:187 stop:924 length:738 start_codon:yes stop_codon:yes gene_type:complete